jgi:hypothetical protein
MTNRSMLDHISIAVSDLRRSIMFYDAALAPLGFVRVWSTEDAAGYGYPDQDENFAIKQRVSDEPLGWSARSHIAFHAASRDAAIAFHAKALENSGIDEEPPVSVRSTATDTSQHSCAIPTDTDSKRSCTNDALIPDSPDDLVKPPRMNANTVAAWTLRTLRVA